VRLVLTALGLSAALLTSISAVVLVRLMTPWGIPGWATYTAGILSVMLVQVCLIVLVFAAIAISSRKSHFFFPLQQYKLLINAVEPVH